jgi:hypothetical protein
MIFGFQAINPYSRKRGREPSDRDVGSVLIKLVVRVPNVLFDVPVCGNQATGSNQFQRVPLEIRFLEGREIQFLLILEYSPNAISHRSMLIGTLHCSGIAASIRVERAFG